MIAYVFWLSQSSPPLRNYRSGGSTGGRNSSTDEYIISCQCITGISWRTDRDSNPGDGHPPTRFPSVRLRPLGHLSTGRADSLNRDRYASAPHRHYLRKEQAAGTFRIPLRNIRIRPPSDSNSTTQFQHQYLGPNCPPSVYKFACCGGPSFAPCQFEPSQSHLCASHACRRTAVNQSCHRPGRCLSGAPFLGPSVA
jgi:hypothetical protein